MLTFEEYQKQAYMAIQPHSSNKEEVMHWAIGLGEEAGEALSVVKHKYYGGQYSVDDMLGELGDVLWHIAALCTALGLDVSDVAEYNLAKLRHRYPSDEFDEDRSQARHSLERNFRLSTPRAEIIARVNEKIKTRNQEDNTNAGF